MGQIPKLTETYLVRHARTHHAHTEAARKRALTKTHPHTKGLMWTDTETQIQRDLETYPKHSPATNTH